MAMKTANDDVYFRIKSAGALKAAGIRLNNADMRTQGEQAYAAAFVENAILVHSEHLTDEARVALAKLLYATATPAASAATTDADEDATADAEETSAEIEAEAAKLRSANTPFDLVRPSELPPDTLYDPDNEFEEDEDEDDYEDPDADA